MLSDVYCVVMHMVLDIHVCWMCFVVIYVCHIKVDEADVSTICTCCNIMLTITARFTPLQCPFPPNAACFSLLNQSIWQGSGPTDLVSSFNRLIYLWWSVLLSVIGQWTYHLTSLSQRREVLCNMITCLDEADKSIDGRKKM